MNLIKESLSDIIKENIQKYFRKVGESERASQEGSKTPEI